MEVQLNYDIPTDLIICLISNQLETLMLKNSDYICC